MCTKECSIFPTENTFSWVIADKIHNITQGKACSSSREAIDRGDYTKPAFTVGRLSLLSRML